MQGYCVKCKKKQDMNGVKEKKAKNGRWMASGTCSKCGCKMTKFLSAPTAK